MRRKCNWYEHGEKSTIFLKNFEKQHLEKQGYQETIKKLVANDKEITDQTHILEHVREFYETLFKTREQKTAIEMETFFSAVDIPKLSENQTKLCDENLTEKYL